MNVFEAISNEQGNIQLSVNNTFDMNLVIEEEDNLVLSVAPCLMNKESRNILIGSVVSIFDASTLVEDISAVQVTQRSSSNINNISTILFLLKAAEQLSEK